MSSKNKKDSTYQVRKIGEREEVIDVSLTKEQVEEVRRDLCEQLDRRDEIDDKKAEIVQQFPFGPLSGAAVNITLLSWRGQVCIGVNLDPSAVTDPVAFAGCLADGFDEVLAAR